MLSSILQLKVHLFHLQHFRHIQLQISLSLPRDLIALLTIAQTVQPTLSQFFQVKLRIAPPVYSTPAQAYQKSCKKFNSRHLPKSYVQPSNRTQHIRSSLFFTGLEYLRMHCYTLHYFGLQKFEVLRIFPYCYKGFATKRLVLQIDHELNVSCEGI